VDRSPSAFEEYAVIELQNMCLMCGTIWLDHKQYFSCASCVEWMAERRSFIGNDAA
jgi:hypothetical protein